MTRAAKAVIDLAALRHNFHRARLADPGARQYAVIKANAYGHGLLPVAQALSAADGFCVSSVEEALALRGAGIERPIVLLEGFFQAQEIDIILQQQLDIVVHHAVQLDALEQAAIRLTAAPRRLRAWLKVDTGMHRLGFAPAAAVDAWQRLRQCPLVDSDICLMTHLANADDLHDPATQKQLDAFNRLPGAAAARRSIANSAGILGWPQSHGSIDRPGILLFGVSPFLGETGRQRELLPVMRFESELIAVKALARGDAVGYGGSWRAPEALTMGIIGVGYGDGYPRHASPGTPVLVNGQRVPLVGRVAMDMICVDLRSQPEAGVGDPVILWGGDLPAEEVAEAAGSIAYALFCGVAARVPRVYCHG